MRRTSHDLSGVTLRAAVLGLATGGRSQVGLAAIATRNPASSAAGQPLRALTSSRGRRVAQLLLVGELVGDKLPATPSRLNPAVLLSRIGAGALSSYVLATRSHTRPVVPVLAGAATAWLGNVLGARWRGLAADRGWPDLPAALVEDAVVVSLALGATRH
jgi:uncharacterized membrane protein